jgi:hypothetical protein
VLLKVKDPSKVDDTRKMEYITMRLLLERRAKLDFSLMKWKKIGHFTVVLSRFQKLDYIQSLTAIQKDEVIISFTLVAGLSVLILVLSIVNYM